MSSQTRISAAKKAFFWVGIVLLAVFPYPWW